MVGALELALEVPGEFLIIGRILTAQRAPLRDEELKLGGIRDGEGTYGVVRTKGKALYQLYHAVVSKHLREIHHSVRRVFPPTGHCVGEEGVDRGD